MTLENVQTIRRSESAVELFRKITWHIVFHTIGRDVNPLDAWIQRVEDETKTTKEKGDLFELLCQAYLRSRREFKNVWLLAEIPPKIRDQLQLKKNDLGIDLVGEDKKGNFHAIQAKFKGHRNEPHRKYIHKPKVTWKEISTFDTLASRTGPYEKHCVITTGFFVRRVGRRNAKDKSICYKTLLGLAKTDFWTNLAGIKGEKLSDESDPVKEIETKLSHLELVRLRRQQYFTTSEQV